MSRAFAYCLVSLALASFCLAVPAKRTKASPARTPASKGALVKSRHAHLLNKSGANPRTGPSGAVRMVTVSRTVRGRNGKIYHTSVRTAVAVRPPAPTYQLHPDEERYVQIQRALADRGYFKGEPNGQWGDDATDALRRFQADQKAGDPDGKINSLTLLGLGLGPRHGAALTADNPAPAVKPDAPPAPPE